MEQFSNPVAPSGSKQEREEEDSRLTNADFRSLLMTPRDAKSAPKVSRHKIGVPEEYEDSNDAAVKRRKKKLYYAKLKKQEEERERELSLKYRDRAAERRDGKNADYQHNEGADLAKTAEYRAVAPTADQVNSAAERRRLAIQESKFLGGDMEHTHLVKGLDFALLQKVRSELANLENEDSPIDASADNKKDEKGSGIEFCTVLGQKIHKAAVGSKPPLRNELFLPGRMAYVFDLDDEYAESDIPTTIIRSKADCPVVENQVTLTTNDIVINKLTQILSYLRQGMRASKKLKKKEKELLRAGKDIPADETIFADIGEYDQADLSQYLGSADGDKNSSYFVNKSSDAKEFNKNDVNVKEFVKNVNEKFGAAGPASGWSEVPGSIERSNPKPKKVMELDSYAECYPGAEEMDDAVEDSDDEADYTKMDMGNKKGPYKRWDFESDEAYSEYMEHKEAMPKAAFQFGIKMHEGRKTRRVPGAVSEKQKLDREWQQISKLISKRKGESETSSGGKRMKEPY